MHVCVTGASGFVGQALVRGLRAEGHRVVGVARRTSGESCAPSRTEWLQWDLEQSPPPLAECAPIDVLVHLAGLAHVVRGQSVSPLSAFRRANVEGARNAADAAVAVGARRFIFASTIGVYGSAFEESEFVSEESELDPLEPYAISKLEAEELLRRTAADNAMELVVLRPALVAGRGAPGNLARLAGLVRKGVPVPVPSRDNARAFVGLRNLAALVLCCLDHPAAPGESFVAAEADWPSTREVVEWIGQGMGKPARTIPVPAGLLGGGARVLGKGTLYEKVFGDLRVDASKARERLGWEPVEPVAEALRAVGEGSR